MTYPFSSAGMRAWQRWLYGIAWFFAVFCAHAQAPATEEALVRIGHDGSYVLSRAFHYLEDTSGSLQLEQVLEARASGKFKPAPQGAAATNFGSTRSVIWLHVVLQLDADAPSRWMLEVANPPLDRLDLYVARGAGFDHQSGGDSLPFAQRVVPHRNHVKPIDLLPGGASELYLRVQSNGTVSAPATLWQPAALWQHDQRNYSVFSLYFGLLIGLLLYNLLLFFSVRDRAYLIYVLFVGCIGVSQAANSGLGAQFLWPGALWWNNNAINVMYSASGTFGIWFARSFLATRRNMPRFDVWMRALVALWVAAIAVSLLLPYRVAGLMVTWLAVLGVASVVAAAVVSIRRRHPGAEYFGLAWGALLLGVVVLTLHNNGLLPSNALTGNALLIGSAFEMVLLSFALADRINVARREKELAQAQTVAEQAMVQALRQSQEQYRAVIEHVGEGMVVVLGDRIVFVNTRATEILEASRDEITQAGVASRIHAQDRAQLAERVRRRQAGEPVPERCQVRLELPGRPLKWLEVGETGVPWDGGQGLLVFFLDVTQRHQAEQDIRTALDRQQELNDLRSRFVAMTSHEFRTPLATILSSQDLLKHYGERLPAAERLEMLANIESGVHRMTRMLDRVLLLGKAEAHMLEFRPAPLDLEALCRDLVAEAVTQQPGNPCQVRLDYAAAPGPAVADEKLLRHIFSNLLSNAIKYSPQGGEVGLTVSLDGALTVFEVSDRGIGVPADELAHLFESFHRASNVGDIHGTGLGLAIVKNSVELHGGSITVASELGQGTRFTVRLATAA